MTTPQQFFLILVIVTFLAFAIGLAGSYIRYRRWLRTQPLRMRDWGLSDDLRAADD